MKKNIVELVWAVPCSLSSTDQERNNVSLFNVIEQLTIKNTDLAVADKDGKRKMNFSFEFLTLWRKLMDEKSVIVDTEINWEDPNEKTLRKVAYPLEIKKEFQRIRLRTALQGIEITGAGYYHLVVRLRQPGESEFSVAARVPIEVKVTD